MHEGTSAEQRNLESALKALRRGIGCTPTRLEQCTELYETLASRALERQQDPAPEQLVVRLTRVVASVEDPKLRESLLVALRLDARYQQYSLRARREKYNEDLKRSPDPDAYRLRVDNLRTLERRENRAISEVACLLANSHGFANNTHPLDSLPHPGVPKQELAIQAISFQCTFSETGVLRTQETQRWVRATSPNTNPEFTVTHQYLNDTKPESLEISSTYGCHVVEQTETDSGGLLARLRIHRDLTPDDGTYSFGSLLRVDSTALSRPVVRWRPRTRVTKRIEFHLTFAPSFHPVRAWWFQSPLQMEGEMEPPQSEGRHLGEYDQGRYLYRIYENEEISPDTHYGISWVWPRASGS